MRFGIDVGGTTVKIGVCKDYKVIDSFAIETTKETWFRKIEKAIKAYTNDI